MEPMPVMAIAYLECPKELEMGDRNRRYADAISSGIDPAPPL
jgi:hypothetical protein